MKYNSLKKITEQIALGVTSMEDNENTVMRMAYACYSSFTLKTCHKNGLPAVLRCLQFLSCCGNKTSEV